MAKNKSTVYLGYDDEEITEKHVSLLNSTLNKIGGTADWPNGEIKIPACPLCGTARPLIVQLYAPLEMSQFHRTLYVFSCLNPVCSQNSKSWVCVRTQHLDTPEHCDIMKVMASPKTSSASGGGKQKKKKEQKQQSGKMSWCTGTDDWGDETSVVVVAEESVEQMDTEADDPQEANEENGNVIKNVNFPATNQQLESDEGENEDALANEEDDEDESNSMDNDLLMSFNQIDLRSGQNLAEDPNANCAAGELAAAASVEKEGNYACSGASATICAEIEGPETDVVLVETPQKPERDLIALLKHTPTPAVLGPLAKLSDITLKPYFMAVDVELKLATKEYDQYGGSLSAEHIRELYQEYKKQDESAHSPNSAMSASGSGGVGGAGTPEDQEAYEKALPAHGDLMFHNFLSTIQQNPGQVLRYSRDTLPLLISPLQEPAPKCPNCNGDTICEVQILSTLIPKLKMQQNDENAPLEYGNVLVFTCLKSCWDTPDKMRYEKVIVQVEK
ncbi:programmed cell death protein 2-like [Calliphora vicina]|uniref:programmed cell death protein 2-like n=1 Tax=Calliphora vicina TaxID=7373 RepID=UPI00325BCEFE